MNLIFYLFKFLSFVLLGSFQEIQQYDVTQHRALHNDNNNNRNNNTNKRKVREYMQ